VILFEWFRGNHHESPDTHFSASPERRFSAGFEAIPESVETGAKVPAFLARNRPDGAARDGPLAEEVPVRSKDGRRAELQGIQRKETAMSQRRLALAVIAAASFAPSAFAEEAAGPQFGDNAYAASIASVGARADTDDYVASLVAGERLTVRVAASKGSALLPALTLVAPDGTEIVPASLAVTRGGKSVALRSFTIPATGRWAVRVAGAGGTEGAYTVTFDIGAARAVSVRRATVASSADVLQAFEGLDGARVDVKLVSRDAKALVAIRGLTAPSGAAVPGVTVSASGKTAAIRGLVLHGGDGTYRLRLGTSAPSATYDLSIKVTPQGRPSSRKPALLASFDPYLETSAQLRGVAGMTVQLHGSGFDPSNPPTVLFGDDAAYTTVAADGSSVSAVVPPALDGETVDVTVVAKDGQAVTRRNHFHYVEMPQVTDLVTEAQAPIRVLATDAGGELLLRGAFFEAGQRVFFGGTEANVQSVGGTTTIRVAVPLVGDGQAAVSVLDAFGRTATSNVVVTFLGTATVDSVTAIDGMDATRVLVIGGATIQLTGSSFHDDDVVTVNGVEAQVVSSTGGTLQIIAPPGAAGPVTLIVTNAVGGSVVVDNAFEYVEMPSGGGDEGGGDEGGGDEGGGDTGGDGDTGGGDPPVDE
jgi:hypothetical protein